MNDQPDTVIAEVFYVEAGRRRHIHEGLRQTGDTKISAAGVEKCNLDDAYHPAHEVEKDYALAAIADGRGCRHCITERQET